MRLVDTRAYVGMLKELAIYFFLRRNGWHRF